MVLLELLLDVLVDALVEALLDELVVPCNSRLVVLFNVFSKPT